MQSGIPYAILRPTILFGTEDILINNVAYLMRRFSLFLLPGDGGYQVQPVHVDDLAELVEDAVYRSDSYTVDAVGAEIFTFRRLVALIGETVGRRPRVISVPPRLALWSAQLLGRFLGDVLLTPQELEGLMANLLISDQPSPCRTKLSDWLRDDRASLGLRYASELDRHYRRE
jgi:NADH dehydrogenase